jgi:hypothetical protein
MGKSAARIAHRSSFLLPSPLLRQMKKFWRWPRFWSEMSQAKQGYRSHGSKYAKPVLFVAGLPKSGTTWLESMLKSYHGFHAMGHPANTSWELTHNGSHNFEIPAGFFESFEGGLCVIKLHCHGSQNNLQRLAEAGVPYVVLYRDLRDAAVSHVFYVKRTPWHPEYPMYKDLDIHQGLAHFGRTLLPEWRDWIRSWRAGADAANSMVVSYERMKAAPMERMEQVADLFALPKEPLPEIVDACSFQNMKKGGSFFRKGKSGDWMNHFTPELRQQFGDVIADDLIDWGYESDDQWVSQPSPVVQS